MKRNTELALYTTVYPGVERYLPAWIASLQAQDDQDYALWVGVDQLDCDELKQAYDYPEETIWLPFGNRESPASLRSRALEQIVAAHQIVVFVDSDDVLGKNRISAAREWAERAELSGCGMALINEDGWDLGVTMRAASDLDLETMLPGQNLFGLTNSTYRTETLTQCLPIPADCAIVDWHLATLAWLAEAELGFDPETRMYYRQRPDNMVPLLPPFSALQVLTSTEVVLKHLDLILRHHRVANPGRLELLELARERVMLFKAAVKGSSAILERYLRELDHLPVAQPWWSCVAHPQLEDLWKES